MTFDRDMPQIPTELVPDVLPINWSDEIENIWTQVLAELTDAEYITRSHHSAGTHDKGCRGPLCRKAYREHPRRKTPAGLSGYSPREERIYDPVMDFFHLIIRYRIKNFQRQLYKELA